MKFPDLGALMDNIFAKEVNLAILTIDSLFETAVFVLEVSQRAVSCELALHHCSKDAGHPAPSDAKG